MKLAFSGQQRFTDFSKPYELYVSRNRTVKPVDLKTYKRIIRRYCNMLAEQILEEGSADLPNRMGTISVAMFRRKPQYRNNKFIGYGKRDRKTGKYDGSFKAFGMVFLPRRDRSNNLRCFGFVANRELFKKVKSKYEDGFCDWVPLEYNDEMI